MKNEDFGFARLTIERPLRRIWRVDEEILLSAPAALRVRLGKINGSTYSLEKEAMEAVSRLGFDSKEIKAAIKAIATTDQSAKPVLGKKSSYEPDVELRDNENISVPAGFIQMTQSERIEAVKKLAEEHFIREIKPYVPDAWVDHSKTKIGYEIPFTRQFYTYMPPRPVIEIREEIESLEHQIQVLMRGLN
jgi:type I restriction enzyme M protein